MTRTNRISGPLILLTLILARLLWAGADGQVMLHLDGYNAVVFDQEYPSRATGHLSLLHGNPFDSAHMVLTPSSGIYGFGDFGSEIGDGLHNLFTIGNQPNRDHHSDVVGVTHLRTTPLTLYARYRYEDKFSDRFDTLWDSYAAGTGARMPHDQEPLTKDYSAFYSYSGKRIDASGGLSRYVGWAATPVWYTPIFRSGALFRQSLAVRLPLSMLKADALIDYYDIYLDHQTPKQRIRPQLSMVWLQDIVRDIHLSLGARTRSGYFPATRAHATLADTLINPYSWRVTAFAYDDGRITGELEGGASIIGPVWAKAFLGYDVEAHESDFRFVALTDTFNYYHFTSEALRFHVSAGQSDSTVFPLTGAVWYDWVQNTKTEIIDTTEGAKNIYHGAVDRSLSSIGARMCYSRDLHPFGARMWANGHIPLNETPRGISVPWNCGMDISWGNERLLHRPFGTVSLEALGPITMTRRFFGAEPQMLSVKEQGFVTLRAGVPFSIPYTGAHLAARLVTCAGPIRFLGDTRMRMHPAGNLIGPVIAVRLEGWLR